MVNLPSTELTGLTLLTNFEVLSLVRERGPNYPHLMQTCRGPGQLPYRFGFSKMSTAHSLPPLAASPQTGRGARQYLPFKNLVFLVFLVFRKRCKPITTVLAGMEHNWQEGGTPGVQNTNGVPWLRWWAVHQPEARPASEAGQQAGTHDPSTGRLRSSGVTCSSGA